MAWVEFALEDYKALSLEDRLTYRNTNQVVAIVDGDHTNVFELLGTLHPKARKLSKQLGRRLTIKELLNAVLNRDDIEVELFWEDGVHWEPQDDLLHEDFMTYEELVESQKGYDELVASGEMDRIEAMLAARD